MEETNQRTPAGVALVLRGFDRWAREDLPGTLELLDDDCEIRPLLGLISGDVYRGHEGARRWFTDVFSHWTEFAPELRAFAEVEDSLLVAGRLRARGRLSGVELDTATWWRFTFRDGRILLLDVFPEPTDAHRAAGLVSG
jgi:ketosteroid isomerase-like protein